MARRAYGVRPQTLERAAPLVERIRAGETAIALAVSLGISHQAVSHVLSLHPDYTAAQLEGRSKRDRKYYCQDCREVVPRGTALCESCRRIGKTCRCGCDVLVYLPRRVFATDLCRYRYYNAQPEKKQKWAAYGKQWQAAHPEEYKAISIKAGYRWRAKNPDKVALYAQVSAERRRKGGEL